MKKLILIFCAIVLSSFTSNETQDVKTILTSGKWYVESTQQSGEEPETALNKNDEWVVFYADGKTEEGLFGDINISKWEYLINEKSIKISGREIIYKKIIEASENKLIIEEVDDLTTPNNSVMITYVK